VWRPRWHAESSRTSCLRNHVVHPTRNGPGQSWEAIPSYVLPTTRVWSVATSPIAAIDGMTDTPSPTDCGPCGLHRRRVARCLQIRLPFACGSRILLATTGRSSLGGLRGPALILSFYAFYAGVLCGVCPHGLKPILQEWWNAAGSVRDRGTLYIFFADSSRRDGAMSAAASGIGTVDDALQGTRGWRTRPTIRILHLSATLPDLCG
jgi:hypothetical protein